MTVPDQAERQVFATAAALLETGRSLDTLSRALTVLAFAGLLIPLIAPVRVAGLCAMSASAAGGLAAAYVGARVSFDAALFRRLASGPDDLSGLDEALLHLGLLPTSKVGRPMSARFAGARRLLLRQALLLCTQAVGLFAAAGTG